MLARPLGGMHDRTAEHIGSRNVGDLRGRKEAGRADDHLHLALFTRAVRAAERQIPHRALLVERRVLEIVLEADVLEDPVLPGDGFDVPTHLCAPREVLLPGVLILEGVLVGDAEGVDPDVRILVDAPDPADLAAALVEDIRDAELLELDRHGDAGESRADDRDLEAFRDLRLRIARLMEKGELLERQQAPPDLEVFVARRHAEHEIHQPAQLLVRGHAQRVAGELGLEEMHRLRDESRSILRTQSRHRSERRQLGIARRLVERGAQGREIGSFDRTSDECRVDCRTHR